MRTPVVIESTHGPCVSLPATARRNYRFDGCAAERHRRQPSESMAGYYLSIDKQMVMNAPRQNNQDNICIYQVQKGGNIQIEVGKDRSSVSAYVTLIYAKNN